MSASLIPPLNAPRRVLMGPGPSDVPPRVLAALAQPTIGHLDPCFSALMGDLQASLRRLFGTENAVTFPISAPGSAGMEACFVNLVEPGDEVLVCINGVFGKRMVENVTRCGATAHTIEQEWGTAIDPDRVRQVLRDNPKISILAFVHAETSSGALSDAAALCRAAIEHECLSIVDTVTGLVGSEVLVDPWGADAVYSGSQKCLSAPPGLSPVTFSSRALARVKARNSKVQSWFLDLSLVLGYWEQGAGGARTYHHTAPVNAIYGLAEACRMVEEEGLVAVQARHRKMHEALAAGLTAMGLSLPIGQQARLAQLNIVDVPPGVDEAEVRRRLLARFGLEIGAALGPWAGQKWRIGLMGYSARPDNVRLCLSALESVLAEMQAPITPGEAVPAAEALLT